MKNIPNLLTCLNLFLGSVAAVLIFQGKYHFGILCIVAAGLFDFLDGFFARLLGSHSLTGKALDSLADLVSFGFVPGLIYYTLISGYSNLNWLPFIGFLFTIFAALRLARFISEDDRSDFNGLPTPAAAVYTIGLLLIDISESGLAYIISLPFLCISLAFTCILMISNLTMFSLKMTALDWRKNEIKWIFLAACALFIFLFEDAAFSLGIILYLVLSVVNNLLKRKS